MKDKIRNYINRIEQDRNICILLACETGSRAWGFPSPDSDYDIRMIYVHKNDWYLSVNEQRDALEMMLENNDLDISGWELRKSLNLLRKSNVALLERIQSPIIYKSDGKFVFDIFELANHCYSKIASIHHYLSMAKKINEEINIEQKFKLKKFFYALRTATLCKWIIDKQEIPPIVFQSAYKALDLKEEVVERIDELINIKATKSESYYHSGESLLKSYINDCIEYAEENKNSLTAGNSKTEHLNLLLRKYVSKYDH